jgi:putative flippase GtrA
MTEEASAGSRPLAAAAQPAKFLLVGAGGYVVNLAVFALIETARPSYFLNSIVSYVIANALMYLGNRYFTFGLSNDGLLAAYVRYVLVGGVVAGLTAALLAVLVEGLAAEPLLGQALALAAVTPVAFVLNKRWTFRLQPA